MAIEVGDAVLRFLGDSTQLDAQFDKIAVESTSKMGTATSAIKGTTAAVSEMSGEMAVGQQGAVRLGEVMTLAGTKARASMYEARGEIGLLGEEFGVKLPRHVRSFVAELPGVGAALSAAFSATAVLFLLQALVEGTKKLSEFIDTAFVYTEAMKRSDESTKELNKELVGLAAEYDSLKQKVEEYGKSEVQQAQKRQKDVKESIKDLTEELHKEEAAIRALTEADLSSVRTRLSITDAYARYKAGSLGLVEALTAVTVGEKNSVLTSAELLSHQNALISAGERLRVAKVKEVVIHHDVTAALEKQRDAFKKIEEQYERAAHSLAKAEAEFKKLATVTASSDIEIVMNNTAWSMQRVGVAMRNLGNDNVDLEAQFKSQKKDMEVLNAEYARGSITTLQYARAQLTLLDTTRRLAVAQGQDTVAVDKQIIAYRKMVPELNEVRVKYAGLQQEVVKADVAFNSMIFAMTSGSASISEAAKKMAEAMIASLVQYAEKQGALKLAEGFGYLSNPLTASQAPLAFESAALFFALAGAGAAVGGAVNGSGGGGGYNGPNNQGQGVANTQSVGTQPNPVQVTNVQKFAEGGLVTRPTMAIMGEANNGAREAAIPLDNQEAIQPIVDALTAKMGQHHTGHTFNVTGLVGAHDLKKFVSQLNAGTKRGQFQLNASNSMRVTRRAS